MNVQLAAVKRPVTYKNTRQKNSMIEQAVVAFLSLTTYDTTTLNIIHSFLVLHLTIHKKTFFDTPILFHEHVHHYFSNNSCTLGIKVAFPVPAEIIQVRIPLKFFFFIFFHLFLSFDFIHLPTVFLFIFIISSSSTNTHKTHTRHHTNTYNCYHLATPTFLTIHVHLV